MTNKACRRVSWETDHPGFAVWLKDRTGFGDRIRYVPDLDYRAEPGLVITNQTVTFEVPPPDRPGSGYSWFTLTADVPEPLEPLNTRANYWMVTEEGAVMIETSSPADDSERFGPSRWTIQTDPDSPLGLMLGAAAKPDPAQGWTETGATADNTWVETTTVVRMGTFPDE